MESRSGQLSNVYVTWHIWLYYLFLVMDKVADGMTFSGCRRIVLVKGWDPRGWLLCARPSIISFGELFPKLLVHGC